MEHRAANGSVTGRYRWLYKPVSEGLVELLWAILPITVVSGRALCKSTAGQMGYA
nr:hypothetical protein [Marortus sp. BJYM1]